MIRRPITGKSAVRTSKERFDDQLKEPTEFVDGTLIIAVPETTEQESKEFLKVLKSRKYVILEHSLIAGFFSVNYTDSKR